MGYYTRFSLNVHEGKISIEEILEAIEGNFSGLDYALYTDGTSKDEVKWYDHEDEMRELSELFPNTVFELYGEGEENDDTWYKYFKGGKMQACYPKITYDSYDESELR